MEKENWIDEVLNITNGLAPVIPDVRLFSRIQQKIKTQKIVAPSWLWFAAASFAVLISINIKMVFFKSNIEKAGMKSVASSLSNSNQLY